ncbi:Ferm And Pdz Domain-Containing Protein 2 [Manis pentadactyla]|nr:Ferm And Pdz Domain-Containing Protein 2 [Manis pentadactyla]
MRVPTHMPFWTLQGFCYTCLCVSPATVTLASALQVRGEALTEEEIWSLLFLAVEQLLEDICDASATS